MRYIVIINNLERLDAGEDDTLETVTYDVIECLQSGYFEIESVKEINEKRTCIPSNL